MNNPPRIPSHPRTPRPASGPSRTAGPAPRRPYRPARGIDVPTSLWLAPTGTGSPACSSSGVLPDWACTRLHAEHPAHQETAPKPGRPGRAADGDRVGLVLLESPTRDLDARLTRALGQIAPGGVLALAFGEDVCGPEVTRPSTAIAAARRAGFIYQQHIVVITTACPGRSPDPGAAEQPTTTRPTPRLVASPVSLRAHRDLYLFTAPTQEPHRA